MYSKNLQSKVQSIVISCGADVTWCYFADYLYPFKVSTELLDSK